MKIHEYQAEDLMASFGIPVNPGEATDDPRQAVAIALRLGLPAVVKAQVLTGGRGKAGGVKLAKTAAEVAEAAQKILGMSIKGNVVTKVLVAKAAPIEREYYLGITVDRTRKRAVLIASASGGVDIEELAVKEPEKILTLPIDPRSGLDPRATDALLHKIVGGGEDILTQAREAVFALYRLFVEKDCSLAEINPYALVSRDPPRLVALDAKVTFDDSALYKHPDVEAMRLPEEYSADELEARSAGLSFVGLDGEIGCIVNGAGLAMATMDLINLFGGTPANFLDVGGSSSPQKVLTALRVILRNPRVKSVLIGIFGGITRCDDIARGILMARAELATSIPIVIRLIGTNEEAGRTILAAEGLVALDSLTEAVQAVVRAARGGRA